MSGPSYSYSSWTCFLGSLSYWCFLSLLQEDYYILLLNLPVTMHRCYVMHPSPICSSSTCSLIPGWLCYLLSLRVHFGWFFGEHPFYFLGPYFSSVTLQAGSQGCELLAVSNASTIDTLLYFLGRPFWSTPFLGLKVCRPRKSSSANIPGSSADLNWIVVSMVFPQLH